jgi:Caspase domain
MTYARRILAVLALLLAGLLLAPAPAMAARRALLIGISGYKNVGSLTMPAYDVVNVATKLRTAGYSVTLARDPHTGHDELTATIGAFIKSIRKGDEVVIYYSGHGLEIDGDNMIVPADAPKPEDVSDPFVLASVMIPMRRLMERVQDHDPEIQVWLIDACRDNPYGAGGKPYGGQGGLAPFPDDRPGASFVLFAAKPGQIARDRLPTDPKDSHLGSPFSRAFATMFDSYKDQDIVLYAARLKSQVYNMVLPFPQQPMEENGVMGAWCFVDCRSTETAVQIASAPKRPVPGAAVKAVVKTSDLADIDRVVGADQSVIFLGKESRRDCIEGQVSNQFPLGCKALQQLSAFFGNGPAKGRQTLAGQTFTVGTSLYLRKGFPRAGTGGTIYGCTTGALQPGNKVTLTSIVSLKYLDDTFYWAATNLPAGACTASPAETTTHQVPIIVPPPAPTLPLPVIIPPAPISMPM